VFPFPILLLDSRTYVLYNSLRSSYMAFPNFPSDFRRRARRLFVPKHFHHIIKRKHAIRLENRPMDHINTTRCCAARSNAFFRSQMALWASCCRIAPSSSLQYSLKRFDPTGSEVEGSRNMCQNTKVARQGQTLTSNFSSVTFFSPTKGASQIRSGLVRWHHRRHDKIAEQQPRHADQHQ
jgi:hypothetical protein